jgi:hypothetical protein
MFDKGVRIVNKGDTANTDIFDIETGEKILNCYRVELDISRAQTTVVLHLGIPFEYEGPAQIAGSESAPLSDAQIAQVANAMADAITRSRERLGAG